MQFERICRKPVGIAGQNEYCGYSHKQVAIRGGHKTNRDFLRFRNLPAKASNASLEIDYGAVGSHARKSNRILGEEPASDGGQLCRGYISELRTGTGIDNDYGLFGAYL